tara:strand:- start:4083 stop:4529 length:447 start_codon:yes stop_codon:yes gene_type:complete
MSSRKNPGRYIGLDVGTKTLGVALSDERYSIASPLRTLKRERFGPLMTSLADLLKGYEIKAFVIGLPLNMNGFEGPKCQSIRDFAKNLQQYYPEQEIHFWDERLTTSAASGFLYEANVKTHKHKLVIDKIAASLILQGYLDAHCSSLL